MLQRVVHRATNVLERAKRISGVSGPDLHVEDICFATGIKNT